MTRSTRDRTTRTRRRPADRVRARLEGLEDRRLLSVTITEFPVPSAADAPYWMQRDRTATSGSPSKAPTRLV